jgi:hypothetical protein
MKAVCPLLAARLWPRFPRATIFALLIGVSVFGTAQGQVSAASASYDSRCDEPPFGDTAEAYRVALPGFKNEALLISKSSGAQVDTVMRTQILAALKVACDAKFNCADRTPFYAVDMSDLDIEDYSTSRLALQYLGTKMALDNLSQVARTISIEDFRLNSHALVEKRAMVSIAGLYIIQEGLEQLYPDSRAVRESRNSPNAMNQHSVSLLTTHAMHSLQQRLRQCVSNPATKQMSCEVTLRGYVVTCAQSDAVGVQHDEPCLNVWDGE